MDWTGFWHMGGYAAFVWPSYGLVLAMLAGQAFWARLQHAAVLRSAKMRKIDDTGTS